MTSIQIRRRLIAATILSSSCVGSYAYADCVAGAGALSSLVTCDSAGGLGNSGYSTTNAGVTIQVLSSGKVLTAPPAADALLTAGSNSVVSNFSGNFANGNGTTIGIDAGSAAKAAITLGGGSTVNNTSNGYIRGSVNFITDPGAGVNTFNNLYSANGGVANIDGDINSVGNTTINNQGTINYAGSGNITQTGAGTVNITNGVAGGYDPTTAAAYETNGVIFADITTAGSTTLNNLTGAAIYRNHAGITLGTLGNGTSTIANDGYIARMVSMQDSTNIISNTANGVFSNDIVMGGTHDTVTNDGKINGNVTLNGTLSNTYNAGSIGSAGNNGLRLPGAADAGTLIGNTATVASNVLNLNGVDYSYLKAGESIQNFGVINKNDLGRWTISATLDGNAGKLTQVNVNGGVLSADNAAFVGSAATTVALSNATILAFNGTTSGTFAGNIVDANAASTGGVTVTGDGVTTLSGNNTYSGATRIIGGSLTTGSNGALSRNSSHSVESGGALTINNAVTIASLTDGGSGTNTVNLNGTATGLTLSGGSWGANGGTITGTGTLSKTGAAAYNLYAANAVNLSAPGSFVIANGMVNVDATDAIGLDTAVVVNATSTTAGTVVFNDSDTIGSLAGTGANAGVITFSGITLTTGGLNTDTTFAGQISGAGALVKQGTGNQTLTGANSYTGGTTVNAGTLTGYAGALQGNIAVNQPGLLVFDQTLANGGTGGSGIYAGMITGTGTDVTFLGNAATVLTLTGNNSGFAGNFNFGNGTKLGTTAISAANNVGTGGLNFYGGTLENTASVTLANAVAITPFGGATLNTDSATTLELDGNVTGTGALAKTGTGTLFLAGVNTYSGGTTVSAGVLKGIAGASLQGDILNNAAVQFFGFANNTYSGVISGTGSVEIINNLFNTVMDFVPINGRPNTYSGSTTVDAGAELVGSYGAFSANSAFIVNGVLSTRSISSTTIGSLAGSGQVNVRGGTLVVGADNTSTTFSGTIGGGGYAPGTTDGVTKIGTGTLTLSGIGSALTGNLDVNAGTLSLTGSLIANTAQVDDGATLSVDGTLSLTQPALIGIFSSQERVRIARQLLTINAGGTLIGGVGTSPGTIAGNVVNNGTVAPGHSPGILAINGSYTQGATGTYIANVNGNGTTTVIAGVDYDQIAVSGTPGTATLGGALKVIQNGGLYKAGTVYRVVTATGGVSGDFASVTGTNISTFLKLSNAAADGAGVQDGEYDLVVARLPYNVAAVNPNQVAVANGLQVLVADATAAGTVIKIDNMTTDQAVSLFNTTNPEPYGAYATALQDQANYFTRQVVTRLDALDQTEKAGLWINGYGQWANGKDRGINAGSKQNVTGFAAGIDGTAGGLKVGVAGGYSEDKLTYRGGNSSGHSKSWQIGGYAAYASGPVHADLQLAYIGSDIDVDKQIVAGAGATLITGDTLAKTKAHAFKGIAKVGYDLGSKTLMFKPYVGVDFASGHVNAFTETGMGVLDLTVDQISANRTDVVAGFKLSAPMGTVTPYINADYRYDVNNSGRTVTAYFNGLSASPFTVSALASGRSQFDVDAGINARIGKTASVFLAYQGAFRNDISSSGVSGGLRIAF